MLLAGLCTAVPAHAAGLFGRGYVSTAVLKGGERHPLFEGIKVYVDFDNRDGDDDVVRWHADCNLFGADVDVTEERLVTGQVEGTTQGCPKRQGRQDRWLNRFFDSDPRWRIRRDHRLKLTAGDRAIRLRQQAR